MPQTLVGHFSSLTHVIFSSPHHQLWADAQDFQQRNVSINVIIRGGDLKQCVLGPVVSLLREDKDAHMFIFVNIQSEVWLCASALEEILSSELSHKGVLSINGDMEEVKKFAHTHKHVTCGSKCHVCTKKAQGFHADNHHHWRHGILVKRCLSSWA